MATSRESAVRAAERELPRSEARGSAPERSLEADRELEVGTRIDVRRLDGSKAQDVLTGSLDLNGQEHQVYARASGNEIRIRITTPEEAQAREVAEQQLDLFRDVLESNAASAAKAAGLKGEAAKEAAEAIMARGADIVAEAAGHKDPEKAMAEAVRSEVEAIAKGKPESEGPTLEQLVSDLTLARQEALGAKNDKQYEAAVTRIHALEQAVFERRAALHPDADKEEKQQIADETEGLVELKPNPLYSEGSEAVRARLKALEAEKRQADKAKDEMAWNKADEEYKQHLGMLPILETKEGITALEEELRAIDKAPAAKGAEKRYKEADAKRKELMAELAKLQKKDEAAEKVLKEEAEEPVVLSALMGIGEPYEPGEMLASLMADIKADQAREDAAKRENAKPKTEAKADSARESEPVPSQSIEDLPDYVQDMLKPDRPPTAEERKQYKDLIESGDLQSEGDIDVWRGVYNELVAAMKEVGIPLSQEGIPESFQQVLDMKDTRGWFKKNWLAKKLFNPQSPRAQMIGKIRDLHYQYVASGHVDASEYLQRQRERQAEYTEQMKRAGRFGS